MKPVVGHDDNDVDDVDSNDDDNNNDVDSNDDDDDVDVDCPDDDEDPETQKNVGRSFSSDWKRLKKSFNENNL